MEHTIKVKACGHICPFFDFSSDDLICEHPYWNDKGEKANQIITQENLMDSTHPEKCPLKNEDLTLHFKLNENVK